MNINKIINLADQLDQMGHHKEAGLLDRMMEGVSGLFSGKDGKDDGSAKEPKEETLCYVGDLDTEAIGDELYIMLNLNINAQIAQYGFKVNRDNVLSELNTRLKVLLSLIKSCCAKTSGRGGQFEVLMSDRPIGYGKTYETFNNQLHSITRLFSRLVEGPGESTNEYASRQVKYEKGINRGAAIDILAEVISKSTVFTPMLINGAGSIDSFNVTPQMISQGEDFSEKIKKVLKNKYM